MAVQEQDKMVPLTEAQTNPYLAKATDFKTKVPAAGSGTEGADKLMPGGGADGPRHTEDSGPGDGYGTPVPGDRSAIVGKSFKVETSKGEGGAPPEKVSYPCSVDLKTGQITPNVEKWKGY